MRPFQIREPALNQATRGIQVQFFMFARILFQVCMRQPEQRRRRTQAIFLQMHERAGELDQALVKRAVRAELVLQPDVFKDFVRLKKKLPVETVKKTGVMPVESVFLMLFHQRGNAFVFATHDTKVRPLVQSPKPKLARSRNSGVAADFEPS